VIKPEVNVITKINDDITTLSSKLKEHITDLDTILNKYNEQITKYNELENKYKELEIKLEEQIIIKNIIKDKFLKEPDMTTVYKGLDNMTISQFKNVIPKMDLEKFTDLTTKDKYFNAIMYMFVRKFSKMITCDDDREAFVEYVMNNEALIIDVRKYLENNSDSVRNELLNFYDFIAIYNNL
jgi:hypothetical protein